MAQNLGTYGTPAQPGQTSLLPRLELLHNPTVTPYLDLIAVHGILDSPEYAWTYYGSSPPGGQRTTNWLSDPDLLPSQIGHLRVWAFQYDQTPAPERTGGLGIHMERTATALRRLVAENTTGKPLLFVAHGYGGLVVLKALLNASLCERTIGLVCLGTAFRPIDGIENSIADTLPVSGRGSLGSQTDLIALVDEFDALWQLLADFRTAKGARHVPIRCFYETESVEGRGIIVPNKAAVLDDPTARSFALERVNHYTMNKFTGPEDYNYELVCDVLQGLVDNAYPHMLVQAIHNADEENAHIITETHQASFPTNENLAKALEAAIMAGQPAILKMLCDANIRVNAHLNDQKDTPLILAARSDIQNKAEIIRALLEKGADVAAVNVDDKSALDYAGELQDPDIQLLLRERPLIIGPSYWPHPRRDGVPVPRLQPFNDFGCTKGMLAKIVDVYEINGEERTFLRSPSVHELLYSHGPRHLMNRATSKEPEKGQRKFRWLHLPANNVTWMKHLIQRTYHERTSDELKTQEYWTQKFLSVTDKSHWEDTIKTSPLPELSHVRYMTPRCQVLDYIVGDQSSADMILFMPYLHYDYTERRQDMANHVSRVMNSTTSFPPRGVANTADENALWAYLKRDIPLHMRRTIDQFFYDSFDSDKQVMDDVPPRNLDQVTQRFMRAQKEWKGDDPLLLMVDQLWMVLLEDDTLITAFPQRWGIMDLHETNPLKDADIANIIAKELSNRYRQALDSPFDMMLRVTDLCANALFDSSRHRNEKLRFFEFFERKIQEITNQESVVFTHLKNRFSDLAKPRNLRNQNANLKRLLDELLDISKELEMMNEIKDIHDELEMIGLLFDQQVSVLAAMSDLLTYPERPIPRAVNVLRRWEKIQTYVAQRQEQATDMDTHAHRTYKSIITLFDMKQRQANALEAHISAKVAQNGERQSVTILVFTVVTIVFLPLSFVSSFYAINVQEFPRDPQNQNQVYMPLTYVVARVFGIGFAIAITILCLAFGVNEGINRFRIPPPIIGSTEEQQVASTTSRTASVLSTIQGLTPTTPILTPLGKTIILDPKRVWARRGDVLSIIDFTEASPCPPGKLDFGAISASPATTKSYISSYFRKSTPKLRTTSEEGDEKVDLARRQTKSWDVRPTRPRRRWGIIRQDGTM